MFDKNSLEVNPYKRVEIIAEIGSVHDGSLGNALRLVDLASDCGANVVKFQTHIAEAETLFDAPSPSYFKGEPRFDYFKRTSFSFDDWEKIILRCKKNNIEFMSSPFSLEAVDMLEQLNIERYKIPSGEVTNIPLLKKIDKTNKPVLLSTGMSSWDEIDDAYQIFADDFKKVTIMQCTSQYPCSYENVGLNILSELKKKYNCNIGYSDHTPTNYAAFLSVIKGASIIEKHLTFSKKMYGSDAKYASEPDQFLEMVSGIRAIEKITGNKVDKNNMAITLREMKNTFEKSIVSVQTIKKGEEIKAKMLGFKKPGTGISPSLLNEVIGMRASKNIDSDKIIKMDDLLSE